MNYDADIRLIKTNNMYIIYKIYGTVLVIPSVQDQFFSNTLLMFTDKRQIN